MALSSRERSPFPIAHRAANDLSALRRAESRGLPIVEADVRLFRGRLEVRHLKTLGPVPVLWDRWTVASPFAPRLLLDELLAAAAPETELLLDLKGSNRRLARLVLPALQQAGRAGTSVAARAWPLLELFRDVPGVRRFHSVGSFAGLRRLMREGAAADVEAVSIHARLLDAGVVARLGGLARTVVTWPVSSLAHAQLLGSWGVSGVVTEDLELARTLLLRHRAYEHTLTGSPRE
jgi:glycerophosphoryl diester phosphodiesterase